VPLGYTTNTPPSTGATVVPLGSTGKPSMVLTVRGSPSGSLSFPRRSPVAVPFEEEDPTSSSTTAASFTPSTTIVTVAVSLPPSVSSTVYTNVTTSVSPSPRSSKSLSGSNDMVPSFFNVIIPPVSPFPFIPAKVTSPSASGGTATKLPSPLGST